MVNFELYKIFVIVANEQNITKASEKLHISQPAVTKHIKNLENMLDTKLFERNNKGLILTEVGNELYQKLKQPIHEIISIDHQFSKVKNVNIGSHNHLLSRIFGNSINQFYFKYPDVNLNLVNEETDTMLKMLKDKELDIIFSKKVEGFEDEAIKYIQLGYLHDVFITNKNSTLVGKTLTIDDLEKQIIYVPRKYAQTVNRILKLFNEHKLNLKNSSYNTILQLASETSAIGLITREYEDKEKIEKYNLVELKTNPELEPVEFGIYLTQNRFKELNDLIKIIKQNFNKE